MRNIPDSEVKNSQSQRMFRTYPVAKKLDRTNKVLYPINDMASITSIVKTADWILSRPTLAKIVTPVAKSFCAYAGYREMGLKYVT